MEWSTDDSLKTNRKFNELGQKSDGSFYSNQTDNYQQDYYQLFGDHQFTRSLSAHLGVFLTNGKGYYEEYKTNQYFSDYNLSDLKLGDSIYASTDLIRQLWLDNKYYGAVGSLQWKEKKTSLTLRRGSIEV